ncbi:hypothetical protein DM02DRAFT_483906, partial [Periconia macrospinosa]
LPQRQQTRRRYYGYHERFLCYIFRIWAVSQNIKEPVKEITGTSMMAYIWNSIAVLVEDMDGGKAPQDSLEPVYENLFQLLVMFWTNLSKDGNMHHNAIVHFSGVLGIHPTELVFRRPYDYTPFLSALIWVGRLIILKQVVVSIAKKHLPTVAAPFDPNTPRDYSGFLKLLSFQTGHKPTTHAGAYALEHGFPSKLQPNLIDRYLESSRIWHEFTLTRATDILEHHTDASF